MKTRSQALEMASQREFDLTVVGGGIVGAGIAQDAASRGMSVLIVEKDDFASGTSSKTTKLVHGGLRYLEQFHFKLTQELCHERALLEHLAPHLVRDFSFILPLTKENPLFGLKARLGLTLYDLLSLSVTSAHRHKAINQREVLEAAPALSPGKIAGGLRFHDCITDDARLVLEVIKSAANMGCVPINYMEARGFEIEGGKVKAVNLHDRYSGAEMTVKTRKCVNAAGVWSDALAKMVDPSWHGRVKPAKGIHIMVPLSAFETNTALFLPTADKRYVFVVPWQRALMIGTTDTAYAGSLDNPLPDGDEVDYLLSVVNAYSETTKLNRSDIIAAWAGLRPLVGPPPASHDDAPAGASTSNLSREHYIFEGPGEVIGLVGGKLTNYRIMAQHVVDRVLSSMPAEYTSTLHASRTKGLMLGGFKDKQDFLTTTASIGAKARKLYIEPATLDHLIASYGFDAQQVVDLVEKEPDLNKRICPDFPPIMAEIPFCVQQEMAVSLEDLLVRRIRLGMLNQVQCLEAAPKVAKLMQGILGWDETRTSAEVSSLTHTMSEHLSRAAAPVPV